jgi:hypothetical protein
MIMTHQFAASLIGLPSNDAASIPAALLIGLPSNDAASIPASCCAWG